ncbi:MAG: dTDP-4-dehydrorhamnose 3,5-epimerase [Methylococcaceae bacterium]|nr:dTDP-4-dehydrorhamnose 3,5-epimerase [Methylococcaceae bacterium]
MGRFDFLNTPIAGLKIVQRKSIEDSRGFLSRFYCAEEFCDAGLKKNINQINHTLTKYKGTVRGMHYQKPPYAETKVVSCLKGEIFDVAVDLRNNSPTFLRWHGVTLSEQNQRSLLIPDGFAHGFQTLSENCELIYLHTTAFHPESEGALNILDPKLGIAWPLAITELSERDRNHKLIEQNFQGMAL